MPKPIKIHDQSKNSYGIIVLTAGIDWTRFDGNPVMLDEHNSSLILGRGENRTINGADVFITPVFNEDNEHAASRMQEYEAGFLNGASLGLEFDWDDVQINPALGFGETPVLVKSSCNEFSLCAIPSNANALQMKAGGESLSPDKFKEKLKLTLSAQKESQINQHNMLNLALLKTALGLAATTSDDDTIAAAINTANAHKTLTDEHSKLKLAVDNEKAVEIKEFLDTAEAEGKFQPAERAEYEAQAKINLSFVKKVLGGVKPTKEVTPVKMPLSLLNVGGKATTTASTDGKLELSSKTYKELQKSGGLLTLKANDKETYDALVAAHKAEVKAKGVVDTSN